LWPNEIKDPPVPVIPNPSKNSWVSRKNQWLFEVFLWKVRIQGIYQNRYWSTLAQVFFKDFVI
jgi:hypothetical protein